MAKFKKGDWVLALVDCNDGYKSGDVFRLDSISENGVRFTDNDGDTRYADHDSVRFEPWTPKVGERVRCVEGTAILTEGKEYAVERAGERYIWVDRGGRHGVSDYPLHYFEPLPVAAEAQPAAQDAPAVPAPLTISAGGFYKTRDGRKVGPMKKSSIFRDWPLEGAAAGESTAFYKEDGTCPHIPEDDLIAEWPADTTTNVAATVDALDEEYGPVVAVADVPVAKPKFKVGDVVKFRDGYADGRYAGKKATVIATNVWGCGGIQIDMSGEVSTEYEADLVSVEEPERTLVRTRNGYGFELARAGDYVWVDVGQKAPITVRAASVKVA